MIYQMKPWAKLSPSGRRYRIKSWENEALSGIDVFCKEDIDMPFEDLVVLGDLRVGRSLKCRSIHVRGNLHVFTTIEASSEICVDGNLDAWLVYAPSLIVKGDSKTSVINAKEVRVDKNLETRGILCDNLYVSGTINVQCGAEVRESIIQKKARA